MGTWTSSMSGSLDKTSKLSSSAVMGQRAKTLERAKIQELVMVAGSVKELALNSSSVPLSWCYSEADDPIAPDRLTVAKGLPATFPRRKERKVPVIHQSQSDNFITTIKNVVKNKFPKMLWFDRASQIETDRAKWEWDRKWMDDLINEPRECLPTNKYCTIRRGMQ